MKNKLADASSDRREREGELKLRDTIETLRTHFPSVRGTLAELCEVNNPKYALAISILLGRHIDSVIVTDQKTALDCINYLKEQRLGMITFIPIDTIKVKPTSDSSRQYASKGFPLAIDCITFESELEKAYLYAMSDALICDTDRGEEEAIKKATKQADASKHKIVTLGGTVIHKSGNMTGGTSTKHDAKSGKLKSASEKSASKQVINEKEYQKLVKRKDELVAELLQIEAEVANAFRQQDEENKLSARVSHAYRQHLVMHHHQLSIFQIAHLFLAFAYPSPHFRSNRSRVVSNMLKSILRIVTRRFPTMKRK